MVVAESGRCGAGNVGNVAKGTFETFEAGKEFLKGRTQWMGNVDMINGKVEGRGNLFGVKV